MPKYKMDLKDARILVVEDNLQNTILISRLLDFMGVQRYEWRSSGWEIFKVVEAMERVDLVLMDLHLPREDGFALLSQIRDDPHMANTLVIAVTADATPKTMEKVKQAGFDGFLGKPINPEKFPNQIAAMLCGEEVWDLGFV